MSKKPKLFFLHFAGGNCYSLLFLKKYFENDFETLFLELPGRGKRISEPLLYTVDDAITDYTKQISVVVNTGQDYFIYGHSLGAFLGFFVAGFLEKQGNPPRALIVSGQASPKSTINKNTYLMHDEKLKKELIKMGGTSQELVDDEDMFSFFNPIIRADYQIIETYKNNYNNLKINIPIHAIMGDSEKFVQNIKQWETFTTNNFSYEILSGNHFFINQHPARIAEIIEIIYKRLQVVN